MQYLFVRPNNLQEVRFVKKFETYVDKHGQKLMRPVWRLVCKTHTGTTTAKDKFPTLASGLKFTASDVVDDDGGMHFEVED